METGSRRLRTLVYDLTDLAAALRKSGRTTGAEEIGTVAKRSTSIEPVDFLNDSRSALEAILLGERDLPMELVGQVLDVTATIDELLREAQAKGT